jgi:hypothetical protein
LYMDPLIVHVSAAPKRRAVVADEVILADEPVAASAVKAADMEKVLVSIHEATAKLTTPAKVPSAPPVVALAEEKKEKTPPAPFEAPKWAGTAELAAAERTAPKSQRGERAWSIQGRIWGANTQSLGAGHFEVGLFAKIDPDGKPVGYPLPQQILPSGQTTFKLDVPARVEHGYLFAEFVSAKTGKRTLIAPATNPWERGTQRLADLYYRAEDAVVTASAAPAPLRDILRDQWHVAGSVSTMFATNPIPQADVVIRVRGRKEAARTDAKGNFTLDLPRLKGTLYLEVLKGGYHPTIVSIHAGDDHPLKIEIASRHAIEQLAQRLGVNQGANFGVFLGQASSAEGAGLRGVTAQLSLKAEGPFYFDDEGNLSIDQKSTGATGRFLFLNVETGTGYLETALNGEAIAPIQVSSVEGGELLQKSLVPVSGSLRGRIFNPVAPGGKMQPVSGARVRVDGASEWVTSDAFGAFSMGPLKWIRGERIALEVSAEKFNNHRYLVDAENGPLNLFAFPAVYIARLARSMDVDLDPYSGVVIGKVAGPALRIDALADQSAVNNAKDFYFDAKGRLRGSHEMTDPRFGTYIIFNVPKGRALLQGNDNTGTLRYSDAVFANPASINVEME